jgi:cytochrome c551/c552
MRRSIRFAVPVLLAACAPQPPADAPPAAPMEPTPATRGQAVAERVCGFCHQVVATRASAVEAAAPSFMEIANQPGRNRDYLRQFAGEEHPVTTLGAVSFPMPTTLLTPDEREDVVLYILSFQRDPATGREAPRRIEPFE